VRCVPKYEIRANILNSAMNEVLFKLLTHNPICWHWVIGDHLFLYDPTLAGIRRGLRLDDVVWANGPCFLQIDKFGLRLKWRSSTLVELFDHPTGLIEVFIDDAFRTAPKFLPNPRPPRLWIRQGTLPPEVPSRSSPPSP
jgi:hypothetical protein